MAHFSIEMNSQNGFKFPFHEWFLNDGGITPDLLDKADYLNLYQSKFILIISQFWLSLQTTYIES